MMKRSHVLAGVVGLSIFGALVACGDDEALVRERPADAQDGAVDAPVTPPNDAGEGGTSACQPASPTDYTSVAYDTNAKLELDLRKAFAAFLKPMSDNEAVVGSGDAGAPITKAQLAASWESGAPSVRSITTPYFQARIDGWLTGYEKAVNAGSMDTAMAALVTSAQTPPENGGFYGKYAFDANIVDLRQAIEKGSFSAAFFNHAVGVVTAGAFNEATTDRLIAAFGAHASFQNNHQATAGATDVTKDVYAAGYAARRTPKDGKLGPYLRAKTALIEAKAAIAQGASCAPERDAAIQRFFLEWEKSNYATVVFYFNSIIGQISPTPPAHTDAAKWSGVFHSHGECLGFIAGFKSIPQAHRKITDAQIDSLLAKSLAPEGAASRLAELKTAPTTATISLNAALAEIKSIYGFSDEEMSSFKTNYAKP